MSYCDGCAVLLEQTAALREENARLRAIGGRMRRVVEYARKRHQLPSSIGTMSCSALYGYADAFDEDIDALLAESESQG